MWVWRNSIGAATTTTTMFFYHFLVGLALVCGIRGCLSLNDEGLALLQFRGGVEYDPHHVLTGWNPGDGDPCSWEKVYCRDGRVEILNLSRLSLKGTIAPDIGRLSHLRSLVLYKNHFHGAIPAELGRLPSLELLDLRHNDLRGGIPAEICDSPWLKHLLVFDEDFEGHDSLAVPIRGVLSRFLNALSLPLFKFGNTSRQGCAGGLFGIRSAQTTRAVGFDHRRLLLLHHPGDVPAQPLLEPSSTNIPVLTVPLQEPGSTNIPVLPEPSSTNIPIQPAPLPGSLVQPTHSMPEPSSTNIPVQPAPMPEPSSTNIPVQPAVLPEPSSTNISVQPTPLPEPPSTNTPTAPLPEPPSTNIPALPPPPTPATLTTDPIITLPSSRSSGSSPAVPAPKKTPSPAGSPKSSPPVPVGESNHRPDDTSGRSIWERYGKYIIVFLSLNILFVVSAAMIINFRRRGMTTIRPWKTGLSGQLQKAFISGVPKLNRSELDVACEDFSNIIETLDTCTVYKGTLSSGVEIAVASAAAMSYKEWSNSAEKAFWKKIDTLSRVNHKNFVNLIGYCEENQPFTRMMVFEYAPNGTFFEHLHGEGVEHLDWSARMRIVMGTAYYLQYIHHDLNPPVAHSDLQSKNIILTDDYAAKIVDIVFSPKCKPKSKISGEEENSEPPPTTDAKANVYSFGMFLLETITGKLPYSEEHGSLVNWASQHLHDKKSIEKMIDPTLKTFKNDELDLICDIIQDCIKPDPRKRPTMKDIVSKLRGVLAISPEQAVPRLSPLWWAELEILSAEAA